METESSPSQDPLKWVDQHGNYLYSLAFSRLRDKSLVEDLIVETLSDAAHRTHFGMDEASERNWLTGILKAKIVEHLKKAVNPPEPVTTETDFSKYTFLFDDPVWQDHWTPSLIPIEWNDSPKSLSKQKEFLDTFNSCVSDLPELSGVAFTLREIDGLSCEEVCEIINTSPTTVESLLDLARIHLSRCLSVNWFSGRKKGVPGE